jgi:signal transduction histidine kinase
MKMNPGPCGFLQYVVWILVAFAPGSAAAADAFALAEVMMGSPLGLHFETYEDAQRTLTHADILRIDASGQFQRSLEEVPNYGLNPAAQWVRFTLHNPFSKPVAVVLENQFTFVDRFTLYYQTPHGAWTSKEAGDQISFASRDIKTRQVVFRFYLEPGMHLFYARTETAGAHQLPLLIWTHDEFFEHNAQEYGAIGILVGIHIVICLYNLFLYFSLKDRTYLIYTLYVFCNLIFQGLGLGFLQQIFHEISLGDHVANEFMIVSVDLVAISALYFSYLFLNIKKRLPSFTRIFAVIGVLDVLNIVVTLGYSVRLGTTICLVNASLVVTVLVISGFLVARRGYRPALFYLVAWGWYIIGVTGNVLNLFGWLPTTAFTRWGQFTGGAFEVAILSLALGARINDKRRRQVHKINELNQALETKVSELINETDCRKSMAAKAAHHLNNPIQAIAGLAENTIKEEKNIWNRLEAMFPEGSERTPEAQGVIVSLQNSFQSIEQNSAMTLHAIRRASVISNELRIMSGVHGLQIQRVSLGDLWVSLAAEIKEDETLGLHSISFVDLPPQDRDYETFIELVSFTRSIFYVLKEGLEAVPMGTPVQLAASLAKPEFDLPRFQVQAHAAAGIKEADVKEWRELKFCRHLLNRFGATVHMQTSRQLLTIDIGLPPCQQPVSGVA